MLLSIYNALRGRSWSWFLVFGRRKPLWKSELHFVGMRFSQMQPKSEFMECMCLSRDCRRGCRPFWLYLTTDTSSLQSVLTSSTCTPRVLTSTKETMRYHTHTTYIHTYIYMLQSGQGTQETRLTGPMLSCLGTAIVGYP